MAIGMLEWNTRVLSLEGNSRRIGHAALKITCEALKSTFSRGTTSTQWVPPVESSVICMDEEGANTESADVPEEGDWHLFASASYGSAEAEPTEVLENQETPEEEWFDGDDYYHTGGSIDWDAPPCPAPPAEPDRWSPSNPRLSARGVDTAPRADYRAVSRQQPGSGRS